MYILETYSTRNISDNIFNNWLIHFEDNPYDQDNFETNTFWMTDIGKGKQIILPTYWVSLRQLVKDLKNELKHQKILIRRPMLIINKTPHIKVFYIIRKLEQRK